MITLQEIQQYRDNEAWSQSQLKAVLSKGTKPFKPSLATLLGSYLDVCLLTPHLKDEAYTVSDIKRPTQTIVDLCESFYKWTETCYGFIVDETYAKRSSNLEDFDYQINEWIQTQSYYSNRPNTRVKTFIEEAKDWWKVLVNKGEREIITTVEELETELMCLTLRQDESLKWIWEGEFQKPFYWEEDGVPCKGLGDIVLPGVYIDLKYTTCPNLREWWKVCANLNYPFQMAFYQSGLGVKKCYWLVVNRNWYELIEVTPLMLQIGKWGYSKEEKIKVRKVEQTLVKKYNGYIDGLDYVNGKVLKETNDELFLINL